MTPWSQAEECTSAVYRHFFIDADTIAFTWARAPEACTESPRMIFQSPPGKARRVVMTPLHDWNIDAMWLTPHFLIFAVTAEYESALPQGVRIVCWELGTGRWFTSPTRHYLMHRPGFDLPALLPDWYSARAYEIGAAIVLRGRERALALWPNKGAWSLVDAKNGRPVLQKSRLAPRQLLTPPEKWIKPGLRSRIRDALAKVHDRAHRDVVDFNILELIRSPCAAIPSSYAVIARAVGRDREKGRPELYWTRELFGVCILDSSLTKVMRSFTPFPSERWADYDAYFDLDSPDDSIVVWSEGDMYRDNPVRHAYPCRP
jgi:hypothetical protein